MPRITLNDVHQLPDPAMDQDVTALLLLTGSDGYIDENRLKKFMYGNRWSRAKIERVFEYGVREGLFVDDKGLKATQSGLAMIGR
jgi:hypothetical protein